MAVKLASAYIELTVKKAGDAMKEITADITGLEKTAQKAGKAAGKALDQGVRDGAKAAGKSVIDEITSAAEQAGADAGKTAGEALDKELTKGAKSAGKSVGEEITNAAKKAGEEAGKVKVEPQVVPKVNTQPARTSIGKELGGAILDGVRAGAEQAGYSLEEVLDAAATKAAKVVGGVLDSAIDKLPFGDAIRDIVGQVWDITEGMDAFNDRLTKLKNDDSLGPLKNSLKDVGDRLSAFDKGGGTGLENALGRIGGKVGDIVNVVSNLQTLLGILNDPATEQALNKIPGVGVLDNIINKWPSQAGGWIRDHLPGLPNMSQWDGMQNLYPTPQAPPAQNFYKDWYPPAKANGGIAGVDSKGKLYGPGTGTSDSILGIGMDGMPTALVSRGEGVVKDQAMRSGGSSLVAALNAGWTPSADFLHSMFPGLPRNDQGSEQDPMSRRWMEALQSGRIGPNGELNPGSAAGSESGLQTNTIRGRRIISALFPEIGDIGGQRQDSLKWHPSGLALDVMIPGYDTKGGKALGDQINAFIQGNATALGSDYTMWQQKDHYNHIHSNFAESGMPGKDQQYMLPPELLAQLQTAQAANSVGVGESLGLTDPGRTQGYIPAGAGGGGQAGTSFMSGVLNMGAQAINGLIDQAASAAATAVSAGVTVGSFGAGAAAGPAAGQAAGKAIGMVTQVAKRGVQWGFQLGGIGLDSLVESLSPFGVSRLFQTDPTQFMPQLPGQAAPVTSGEKAHEGNGAAPGPVQPGQLPGQQPVGAPAQQAQAQGIVSAPTPIAPKPTVGPAFVPTPKAAPVLGPYMPTLSLPVPTPPKPTQQQPQSDLAYLLGPGTTGTFDVGGMLQPGGIAINKTRRPEPILSTNQWGDLAEIASRDMPELDPRAAGASNDYSVHIDSVTVKDVEEMQRTIDSRQRLQMMRYAGRP
ncbi:hypothetical protein [Mycolicibacter arupensis]|jgi:hypothetical protein|uniref:ARB-07466-like C-terminal domain-containing protein n=1 Tax=Mycolicibacter arupensis TaxID=342002 RepID=A0A5C7XQN0_9MYCO|nr:hypothetical protein [Mycolicibacter arupensis]TXI51710.1 MAG: hypothetical protein E6Q54_20075 [Mycolicibacter arupensis]